MTDVQIDTKTEFIRILRNVNPALYTIELLQKKLTKDMEYGEIHMTLFVKEGKIIRVEAIPKYSKIVPKLDNET